MTIIINEATTVKYYLVKVVDGVEVRRTEIKPTNRDKAGRFTGSTKRGVTPDPMVTCPCCGARFRVGRVLSRG